MLLFVVSPIQAAEITPNPSSYSYGSTSEVAPSIQIQSSTSTSSSSNLAGTGESAKIIQIVAGVLLISGVGLGLRLLMKKQKT